MVKRFPSYQQIVNGALTAFRRFPFTLISAVVASALFVYQVEIEKSPGTGHTGTAALVAVLGVPLFTALAAFAEKKRWSGMGSIGLQVAGGVLLVLYYFTLPQSIDEPQMHIIRYALLFIAFHFLVAVLPYLGGDEVNGFWQYNKTLFLRFLTAALYSAVLYCGLAIALAAVDQLFGIPIDDSTYFQLWIVTAGVFNTWVFLGGFPADLNALNESPDYPKGLKVFTQFILLPLVMLYFVILIAYELKIIISWNWPQGWVSQLVLWYSVVGILSMLFLYPLRERVENKWIQVFMRWFFRGLVPLVVMLFLAIWVRIGDYGMTENRYLVLVMAIGLAIVMVYFIFSRKQDPRVIPAVICALALLSAYGPWSAFSVSEASQKGRLADLMRKNAILVDGTVEPATGDVALEDRGEMSSIISYLNDTHGLEAFSDWFSDSTLTSLDTLATYRRPIELTKRMGFEYAILPRQADERGTWFSYYRQDSAAEPVGDYDYVYSFDRLSSSDSLRVFQVDGSPWRVRLDRKPARMTILRGDLESVPSDSAVFQLDTLLVVVPDGSGSYQLDADRLAFTESAASFEVRFTCMQASGRYGENGLALSSIGGRLLLRMTE